MELAIFADCWKSFLFDRCGAELDAVEDRRIEDVDPGIDPVSYEFDWFFNKAIDS